MKTKLDPKYQVKLVKCSKRSLANIYVFLQKNTL